MDYIIRIKKEKKSLWKDSWAWKMAWRDARHNFGRLLLFITSVIIGIAALVSINSFNENLQQNINDQAKELLGADYEVSASEPLNQEVSAYLDSIGEEQSEEITMASMARFMTSTPGTRLVRLVAMSGDFPFYGKLETLPAGAMEKVKSGKFVIMDRNLATQYDVSSEDSIAIGNVVFKMAGEVIQIPNGGGLQSTFTPSVYFSMDWLDSTGLVQFGSRVTYKKYVKAGDVVVTREQLRAKVRKFGYSYETVESRREDLGEGFTNLYRFFNLLAFVALILGGIGVASSVSIYMKEKRESVAVLRCLGASGWQTFHIFMIQAVVLGLIGSIIGVLFGVFIQYVLPLLLQDFIPLELKIGIAWNAVLEGLLLGLGISLLFSMLPLLDVRFIPPLSVLRTSFEPVRRFSKSRWLVIILVLLFPLLFASYQTQSLMLGVSFFAGLLVAFVVLYLMARLIVWLAKKVFPDNGPFILKQSLANLFRPNNQTFILMVVIGLGVFLITTLNIIQNSLLNQVEFVGRENQSNTILFDIQRDQVEGVVELTKDNELDIIQLVPIVTCRLKEVKGKTIKEIQADTTDGISNWAVTREYRVTYRDSLTRSEKLLDGQLQHVADDSVFVTISEGMQDNLEVGIGDSLVFDVQGVPFKVYISGIREVDWPEDPPNFIFVFPTSILEEAPQIFVLTTRIDDEVVANKYQRELVTAYPNVSLIDIRLILSTIDDFFSKVSFVIQFMALFSIATGLIVLAGAVVNSKFTRLKENALLRTIGASGKQITGMTLLEYVYLGVLAGVTGMLLSLVAGFLLAKFFFEIVFSPDIPGLFYILIGVVSLTVIVGWWNTREVIRNSPLAVLRRET
ncbi:ABC transporter permease [Fulvivirga sedimenti]|uniref:FtsX-like permease family protein n=1 Tax=Fulvivirga sedimenti TaxID=2879465 RepID=A0A9X1HMH9_9BACT|nr:FtsX-like permease family protein [Fulvivirga sedimenti]MCA6073553.1 FtsX-like permease family protein [Fulvivirga sedimenti]